MMITPSEFYFYSVTGVYPCDEYYGVGCEELLSVKELIAARRRAGALPPNPRGLSLWFSRQSGGTPGHGFPKQGTEFQEMATVAGTRKKERCRNTALPYKTP